jgi:phospholipase C
VGVADGGTGQYGYKDDYIAHHEPFQYYASTANPHHLSVDDGQLHGSNSLSSVGSDTQSFSGAYGNGPQFDTPNHNYDTSDFDALVTAINAGKLPANALPAVTFLKAPGYEDGHAQYSNPRDEQAFSSARSTRSSSRPTGRAPRSSSTTTTPTAGTTTSTAA